MNDAATKFTAAYPAAADAAVSLKALAVTMACAGAAFSALGPTSNGLTQALMQLRINTAISTIRHSRPTFTKALLMEKANSVARGSLEFSTLDVLERWAVMARAGHLASLEA